MSDLGEEETRSVCDVVALLVQGRPSMRSIPMKDVCCTSLRPRLTLTHSVPGALWRVARSNATFLQTQHMQIVCCL